MKKLLQSAFVTALLAVGVFSSTVLGQLPGPPVGAPQSIQNASYGYNFQYSFIPSSTTGAGFRVNPTLNLTIATGQNDDVAVFGGSVVLPNSSASVTTASTVHVGTLTCTLNSGAVTNCANLLVDAAPATGTNKYSIWSAGAVRLDSTLITNAGASTLTLPSSTGGVLVEGYSCGSTGSGNQTCTPAAASALYKLYNGSSTLSSNAATITFAQGGFTSTTSYFCVANDVTTRANPVQMIPASATTATITNTTGASDVIQWLCAGQ